MTPSLDRPCDLGIELMEYLPPSPRRGAGMERHACPSAEDLGRLLAECLSSDDRDRVSDHLEGCADCQRRLDELLADGSIASLTQADEPPEGSPDSEYLENLRNLVAQKALS